MWSKKSCYVDDTKRMLDVSTKMGLVPRGRAVRSGPNFLPKSEIVHMNIGAYCDSGPGLQQVLDPFGQEGRRPVVDAQTDGGRRVRRDADFDVQIDSRDPVKKRDVIPSPDDKPSKEKSQQWDLALVLLIFAGIVFYKPIKKALS